MAARLDSCCYGNRKEDYEELESKPIADELHIYTWYVWLSIVSNQLVDWLRIALPV